MKLQKSNRHKQCVVAAKSSLALSKMFHAGAYVQGHTAILATLQRMPAEQRERDHERVWEIR